MRLGWDEIARRARAFSEEWKDAHYEKGETQSFYNDFFEVFGIRRRTVADYERRVTLLDNRQGFVDLFWPRTLLVEQKSSNLDLKKAETQALDYLVGIHPTEQPRFILTCDFQKWVLRDRDGGGDPLQFSLKDLHKHVQAFDFMLGRRVSFERQESVTIKAAELMGRIHDALEANNYTGHNLERFLVRLLFCMFADDTGIFQPKDIFLQLIENDTAPDGSNVGRVINELFEVLDTPEDQRQANLSGELNQFPYVNGRLFRENLRTPIFDAKMREDLLDACRHDWSSVSPAIFGSLFQSVMDAKERRAKGAHYTSEANILKVIGPLFLDELREELETLKARKTAREKSLLEFQARLSRMRFLDPACGCGNFLVIAYREVRQLELECLQELYGDQRIDAALLTRVTVDQFYGIEYEEFPAMIAEVAMWMADHIANNAINEAFRLNYARIPLTGGATIRHGDALEVDWNTVLPAEQCSFVMGNPPFVGAKFQTADQRAQVRRIAALGGSGGTLDYVAAWFLKAGQYVNGMIPSPLQGRGGSPEGAEGEGEAARPSPLPTLSPQGARANRRIRIAFVSTNSITQGEQVAQLWPILFDRYGLEIAFAHRTFNWFSEARGKAHVHVVIVGLTHRDFEPAEKRLFSYPDIKSDPVESRHGALTAYLFDAKGADRHLVVASVSQPINGSAKLITGSKPLDGGYLTLGPQERAAIAVAEPEIVSFIRPYLGASEFINDGQRWILSLQTAEPAKIRASKELTSRLDLVRRFRQSEIGPKGKPNGTKAKSGSSAASLAASPLEYHVTVIPERPFLAIPQVSSERREYAPIGWLQPPTIPSDKLRLLVDATLWDFSIVTSTMHMAWMRAITGRMKSDYMYSVGVVYNTFPWPEATPTQREKIESLAQAVLDARAAHPTSSLADLYDPDTMPANLRRAHAALDVAVDRLYRRAPFESDRDRVEHLFGLYEKLVNPLSGAEKANRRTARKRQREG
ncbi:class I SAM-dependent DNA methyltransferase [Aurantiacibacter arachoides]|uniref:class I SAM-dependent DNA methyltransferase n=1 Tax=Aurantiacibacter arachoides TaxID=1850444 RepID=UPI0019A516C0|nr:DNA methyltransferase [Aurantiacibacter arachoides]GGD54043.1 methylase [Aurantiacibacter arachoides]